MVKRVSFIVLTLAAIAIVFAGCGGGGGDAPGIPGGGSDGNVNTSSTVRVLLTDAPATDLSEVWVNVLRVELVPADEGPIISLDSGELPAMFELLSLADEPAELGVIEVPAGAYSQVRLVLAETGNFLVDSEGVEHDLRVPSGAQSGIKVTFPDGVFEVGEGQTTLLLDFLAGPSVHQAGNSGQWIMRPVIHGSTPEVAEPVFGAIEGTVIFADESIPQPSGDFPPAVFAVGDEALAIAEIDPETGAFSIPSLLPGDYELKVGWLNDEGGMADGGLAIVDGENLVGEVLVSVIADDTANVSLIVQSDEEDGGEETASGAITGTVAYEDDTIPQAMDGAAPAVFVEGDGDPIVAEINTETGAFEIPSLPAGDYTLHVGWSGDEGEIADASTLIITDEGEFEEISVTVEADATLQLDLSCAL